MAGERSKERESGGKKTNGRGEIHPPGTLREICLVKKPDFCQQCSKVQHNTLTFGSGVLVFLGLRDGRQEEEVAEEEVGKEG